MSQLSELFDFGPFFDNFDKIIEGFWATVRLSVGAGVLSLIIGTILVSFRVSPVPVLRSVGTVYVNVLRNTPLTLVLLMCALGLNDTLALQFSDDPGTTYYWWAVIGLSAYTGAFVCEALRSGINTVPLGQAEAARSLGLTFSQNLRLILLPQAFRAVIMPLGSVLIALTKNTTIAAAIGVAEAALLMKEMIENTAAILTVGSIFALGFVVLTLPTGLFFSWLGKRLAVAR